MGGVILPIMLNFVIEKTIIQNLYYTTLKSITTPGFTISPTLI